MPVPLYHVDAFADRAFGGNPAAVCLLEAPADSQWMQRVAAEMNLPETAFVERLTNGFGLRWFTPGAEVDLCGHATLASAHVLWETKRVAPHEPIQFHTRSGVLTCTRDQDWIVMDFPAVPATPCPTPIGLLEALGVSATYVGHNRMDYLVQVATEEIVRRLSPNFESLKNLKVRGIIVTARSAHTAYDFVSRFFAPAVGINEDPVTGSAHCCLAPFWAQHLGRDELTGFQASQRGGMVRVKLEGDRVELMGNAVTVISGSLHATPE